MSSLIQNFAKSLTMNVLSEIGDRSFLAAAILAMRHPRRHVLLGCLTSLFIMTALSAALGWAAPNLDDDDDELAEVEAELDADSKDVDSKGDVGRSKEGSNKGDDALKRQKGFLSQFFSPIFLKAFSITFFGEWGDRSQLATVSLAADGNPLGVVLGGVAGQALCTIAAVLGGKSLASQISERIVSLSGGVLFIAFGIQSFLTPVDS